MEEQISSSKDTAAEELAQCERASQLLIDLYNDPEGNYRRLNQLAENEGDKWTYAFLMELKFSRESRYYDPISVPVLGVTAGIRAWLETKLADPAYRKYAAYLLGVSYFYGLGCDKDAEKCWEYLRISGDEYNYVLAICIMAECAALGFGLPQPDMTLALKYNKQASDLGYEGTYLPTANSFLYGVGTAANPEEALRYYKLAAHCPEGTDEAEDDDDDLYDGKGNAQAMYFLAACYMEGVGVPHIDEKKGIRWLKRSAEKGYSTAIEQLAELNLPSK